MISTENSKTGRERLLYKKERKEKQRREIEGKLKIKQAEKEGLIPKNRSSRYYKRGHILEDHLIEPLVLTDDDVRGFLDIIFSDPDIRMLLENRITNAKKRITGSADRYNETGNDAS